MDKVHTEELRGYTINIYRDPDPLSPEENADEHAFLVYDHRDFTVFGPNKETARMVFKNREGWEKTHHVYTVYAYIHSGVRLGLSTAGMVDVQWDVSTTGFILITRDKSEISFPEKYAQGMIDEWNRYLSGDVYGYKIEDGQGEHVDSCWGFYGLEYCQKEARGAVPDEPWTPKPAAVEAAHPITVFNDRELNTVLHALRVLQEIRIPIRRDPGCYSAERDGYFAAGEAAEHGYSCDHFDEGDSLSKEEIDALCERLQLQPEEAKPQSDNQRGRAVWEEKAGIVLSPEVIAARAGVMPSDPRDDEPEEDTDGDDS